MNELYRNLSLYLNYFHPVMKQKSKERIESKIKRIYDKPRTPYQRVLESLEVPEQCKEKIKQIYARLTPAELHRVITRLQNKLMKITLTSKEKRNISAKKQQPFIKTQVETCNYQFG